ncbi:MAG: hypothetical protein QXX36_02965 [Candidatus Rehaiarchaeum fermentans]|nr:hypothetical protein [Candidatus Rehaiarchaeum fermentans]
MYDTSRYKTVKVRSVSTILKEFNISEPYLDIKGKEFDVINDDAISI